MGFGIDNHSLRGFFLIPIVLIAVAAIVIVPLLVGAKTGLYETTGQWDAKVAKASETHLRSEHPQITKVSCVAGESWAAPRCLFSENNKPYLATFDVGSRENGGSMEITFVRVTTLHPYTPIPAFVPSINGETQEQYEEHRSEIETHEQETT